MTPDKIVFGPQTFWEEIEAFVAAVRWTEPWLVALFISHFLLATLTVYTRHSWLAHAIIITVITIIVLAAKTINTFALKHWSKFATQPYFADTSGAFIGIVLCLPLLLIACYILINGLIQSSRLLITVKKQELKDKQE